MDLQPLHAQVEDLMGQFEKLRAGAVDLQRQIAEVEVTEKSDDGMVTATVGSRGQVLRIELDPRIYRRPDSTLLAETITETITSAAEKAHAQVLRIGSALVPEDEFKAHLDGDMEAVFAQLNARLPGMGG